jgi:hypothetical protein
MAITRLTGGLTPADGSDPRTFPTIWNGAVDDIEQAESDISALDSRVDNLTTDEVAEATNLYFTDQRAEDAADRQIAAATTDDLDEGATNLYYTDARVDDVIAASDTDDLSEGATNLYYTDTRVETVIGNSDTDDLSEGSTNLYYTDQRVEDVIAASDTDDLSEGSTNLYYTDARVENVIANSDTDDLAEGSTNLYYTDTRVENVIAASDTDDLSEGTTNLYFTSQRASDAAPVQSVNGQTGTAVLDASDVGALPDDAELGDLADVVVTGVTDGQLIAYNATSGKWELASPAGITTSDITALNLTWDDF